MTRPTRLVLLGFVLSVALILIALVLFQDHLSQFDAHLYATMTAIR